MRELYAVVLFALAMLAVVQAGTVLGEDTPHSPGSQTWRWGCWVGGAVAIGLLLVSVGVATAWGAL